MSRLIGEHSKVSPITFRKKTILVLFDEFLNNLRDQLRSTASKLVGRLTKDASRLQKRCNSLLLFLRESDFGYVEILVSVLGDCSLSHDYHPVRRLESTALLVSSTERCMDVSIDALHGKWHFRD